MKICPNCHQPVEDTSRFCVNCGTPLADPIAEYNAPEAPQPAEFQQPPVPAAPAAPVPPVYQQPVAQPAPQTSVTPSSVLTWGILGLAFSCTFFLSFLGIIFSVIARKKHKRYLNEGGINAGPAKVGGILAKIGLIVGIILTVLCAIYIIVVIVAAIRLASNPYYYIPDDYFNYFFD